ncbi:MAG: hypothetical protein K8T91_07590 [Planctomycetes bacterium]|nr:hypothetical protein [Planctomycetota bacterium]
MHSTHTVRLWADDAYVAPPDVVLFQLVRSREPSDPLRRAIARSRQALLARQQPDGSFAEARPLDPRSLATLVLSTAMLESYQPAQFRSFARGLLEAQWADGGWAATNGGPLDLSATVLAYLALKLSGQTPASEPMVCARRAILSRGGATKIDLSAQVWLAMFGQQPYESLEGTPTLERLLLAHMARSPQRTEELPSIDSAALCQAIVAALRPRRHLESGCGIRELFLANSTSSSTASALLSRFCRAHNFLPLRRRAIAEARRILLTQIEIWKTACDQSLTTSATPDSIAWALVALDSLGFTADTPARQNTHRVLESLLDIEADTPMLTAPSRVVAARTITALRASGLYNDHPDIRRGLHWLRGCLPLTTSEAAQRLTLMAAPQQIALRAQDLLPPSLQTCVDEFDDESFDDAHEPTEDSESLTRQILTAQRPDGAWPDSLAQCGRSAVAEPPDISATSLAMMALAAVETNTPKASLNRAAAWLLARQQPDGSWPAHGTEGAVPVTSRVLQALIVIDADATEEAVSAGAEWLIAHQQPGGGWGDAEPGMPSAIVGEGSVTAQHTAVALQALLAVGRSGSEAVARGTEYLVSTQTRSGDWAEPSQDIAAAEGLLQNTVEALLALGQYAARPRDTEPSHRPMVRLVR